MKKSKIVGNGNLINVFPDEETFQRIYSECLEKNAPPASETLQGSYRSMDKLFHAYLEAIQEQMFRYAYQCGFEAALRKRQENPRD